MHKALHCDRVDYRMYLLSMLHLNLGIKGSFEVVGMWHRLVMDDMRSNQRHIDITDWTYYWTPVSKLASILQFCVCLSMTTEGRQRLVTSCNMSTHNWSAGVASHLQLSGMVKCVTAAHRDTVPIRPLITAHSGVVIIRRDWRHASLAGVVFRLSNGYFARHTTQHGEAAPRAGRSFLRRRFGRRRRLRGVRFWLRWITRSEPRV